MKFEGLLRKNFWLKSASLLLAIFLELYFYGPDNSTTATISVPIEFVNIPRQMMIVSPRGAERGMYAEVLLRGPRPLIEQLRDKNNRFSFDLATVDTMNPVVFLTPQQIGVPAGVTVEISPERVKLGLETVLRKELDVSVVYRGEPAPNHVLSHFVVEPKKIIVDGPKSELVGLRAVETQPIDINGLRGNKSYEVALENPMTFARYSVNTVSVNFVVSPIESLRDFEGVGIKLSAKSGQAATVEPSRVHVRVAGAEEILQKLERSQLKVFVDVESLPVGKHEVSLSTELPTGVQLLKVDPDKVTVTVVSGE